MPGVVQMLDLLLAQSTQPERFQQIVEDHAVKRIDVRPGQLALAHAVHGRVVARAPGIGELRPVDAQAFFLREQLAFADDGAPPVDDGTEHIESQCLDHSSRATLITISSITQTTSARQTRPTVLSRNGASAGSLIPSSGRGCMPSTSCTGMPSRTPIAPAPAASTMPAFGSGQLAA